MNEQVEELEGQIIDCSDCKCKKEDVVNHPSHYTSHPSGIECIEIVQHMNFCLGGAVKYLWRADLKGDPIENLNKAIWLIKKEIERRERSRV